jgi:3-oxoacyl-[acyl-carrier protein] reductase
MTLAVRIHGTLPGMSGRLDQKIAVVTGAGSGIGRATVRRFAAEGARVIAADRDLATAHETCAGILNAQPVRTDVTDRDAVEKMLKGLDRIDVYFNNAGIPEQVKPLAQITQEEWDAVIDVNLTSLFIAAQVAAPKLKGGVLLVTGSIIANRPRPGLAAYVASKNGVIGLARALAIELAPDIRVNVINPGPANTPMLTGFGFDGNPADALPLKRLIEPEDIAGAAVYLASDDAKAITGAVFNVDAGRDL